VTNDLSHGTAQAPSLIEKPLIPNRINDIEDNEMQTVKIEMIITRMSHCATAAAENE
jgi:hypothetical protein